MLQISAASVSILSNTLENRNSLKVYIFSFIVYYSGFRPFKKSGKYIWATLMLLRVIWGVHDEFILFSYILLHFCQLHAPHFIKVCVVMLITYRCLHICDPGAQNQPQVAGVYL